MYRDLHLILQECLSESQALDSKLPIRIVSCIVEGRSVKKWCVLVTTAQLCLESQSG